MAQPILRRYSDGLLISDFCVEWSDWQPEWAQSENRLLAGGVHVETWGTADYSGEAVFKFRDSRPGSTHAKKRLMFDMIHRNEDFTFLDLEGLTHRVTVSGPPEIERVPPRHVLVVTAKLTLLRREQIG